METSIINFSSKIISFTKDKNFLLQITNLSSSLCLAFKIKTTKLNTYEVKPPMGSIQPSEKKQIQFKIVKPLSLQQIAQSADKDKFQLQFLSTPLNSVPKTKPQFKTFWDQAKNDPSKEGNFCNFTFPVVFEENNNLKTVPNGQPFSPLKSKNSLAKSGDKGASVKKLFTLQPDFRTTKNDDQLSKQYQKLKQQQQKLVAQRYNIFRNQPKSIAKKKSGGQIVLLIIAFLLSIMIGNFLKLRVFVEYQQL